jgi:uncharacterized protein (TIGR02466 family)
MQIIDTFKIGILIQKDFLSKIECQAIIKKSSKYQFTNHNALNGDSLTTYNTKKNEISDYLTANQISKLLKLINSYCQSTGFPTVNISNAWINIQGKNTILKKHAHPLSVISGALFLKADQDSSGLYFSNPLKHHYQPIEHTTPYSFEYYKINAIQGTLVIFPSWLEHSSNELINNSNKRIVLSFNTNKI